MKPYEHTYPHNWRDDSPLMYFARETWFINTLEFKQQLIDLESDNQLGSGITSKMDVSEIGWKT